MAKQMTAPGDVELTGAEELAVRGTTQPTLTVQGNDGVEAMQPAVHERSYIPTRWPLANKALDVADTMTGGKGGWIQRLVSYLFVGGFAAVVNLIFFHLMYEVVNLPFVAAIPATAQIQIPIVGARSIQEFVRYLAAFLIATEISIFANFIPNDRITFSHLPGHSRSWFVRCWRFHLTCVAGTILTLILSLTAHQFGLHATLSQAIAIVIVTAFNFTMHHLFTYRHKPEPVEAL